MLSFFLGFFSLTAQKTLSQDSLWSGMYSAKRMESIRSLKDGASYTVLKNAEKGPSNRLVQSYYENPDEVVVLVDAGNYEQIERFSDYSFSKNEEKILLESEAIPLYRRSKIATYWIFDRETKALQQDLQEQMAFAAKHHLFEEAALLRDRIQALEKYSAKQKMVDAEDVDRDLFAVAVDPNADLACGVIFLVREGKIIGRQQKMIRPLHDRSSEQLLQALLERYYAEAQFIPDEVWLSHPIEQPDVLESLLHEQKGRRVPLRVPARGEKAALLRMVVSNADLQLEELKLQYQKREEGRVPHAVVALQQDLGLSSLPRRMECFDISHLGGTGTVASCVVFIDGKPRKSAYRSFRLEP